MNPPQISFEFDQHAGFYLPGDTIAGEYVIEVEDSALVRSVECAVLWYTVGKGDQDLGVHYFQRQVADGLPLDLQHPRRFSAVLPASPLSYDGAIVKIYWCVRVRVFPRKGRDFVEEQPFQLGGVPAVALPEE